MTVYWNFLRDLIDQLFTFMFTTYIPNTSLTFGGLYVSLFLLSVACAVLGMIIRRKGDK